jgi:hypothetical protein
MRLSFDFTGKWKIARAAVKKVRKMMWKDFEHDFVTVLAYPHPTAKMESATCLKASMKQIWKKRACRHPKAIDLSIVERFCEQYESCDCGDTCVRKCFVFCSSSTVIR